MKTAKISLPLIVLGLIAGWSNCVRQELSANCQPGTVCETFDGFWVSAICFLLFVVLRKTNFEIISNNGVLKKVMEISVSTLGVLSAVIFVLSSLWLVIILVMP